MPVYRRPLRSDELMHWGRGEKAREHKYIAREKSGKGFKYFYSQEEWNAFKNKASQKVDQAKRAVYDAAGGKEKREAKRSYHIANSATKRTDFHYKNYKKNVENANRIADRYAEHTVPGPTTKRGLEQAFENFAERANKHAEKYTESYQAENNVRNKADQDYAKYQITPVGIIDTIKRKTQKVDSSNYVKEEPRREITEKVLKNTNPTKSSHNCARCAATMALYDQGYNVKAEPAAYGESASEIASWFEDGQVISSSPGQNVDELILQQGENASGIIGFYYGGEISDGVTITMGGHAIFYRVENGKVKYYDGQNNLSWNSYDEAVNYAGGLTSDQYKADIVRTDNKKPNFKKLVRDGVCTFEEKKK